MNTSEEKSVIDQLFNAIDDKNYAIARYKLCRAIEAANENTKTKTARADAPDHEGQA